jgi:GNAT superfamily N-acetyltransferase
MLEVAQAPPTALAELREGLAAGLLWVVDDRTAGVVAFALARRLSDSLHLAELSVAPSHGRRGLGSALVRRVADAGRGLGFRRLTLSTFVDVPWNAAFYRRLGFRSIDDADLSHELRAIRRSEAAAGVRVEARVMLSLALERP